MIRTMNLLLNIYFLGSLCLLLSLSLSLSLSVSLSLLLLLSLIPCFLPRCCSQLPTGSECSREQALEEDRRSKR